MSTLQTLVVIAGPTGAGKTALSIALAKKTGGEIISGDSMQVYQELNIGTAKITPEEMEGISHHLIDILPPGGDFHVQEFQKLSRELIQEINQRGKIPILTGGTGLYIDALVYHYEFGTEGGENPELRENLWKEFEIHGIDGLRERLYHLDPEIQDRIDPANPKRIIRALEYSISTGIPFSSLETGARTQKKSPYNLFYFGITMNRDSLYDKINRRVDEMFAAGWLKEVTSLLEKGLIQPNSRSMQSIGYKRIMEYLQGTIGLEECKSIIKQDTRRFAKRQLTWFRKNPAIIWFDRDLLSDEEILDQMTRHIRKMEVGASCPKTR